MNLFGEPEAILVLRHDEIEVISIVSRILADNRINIAGTASRRKERGDEALMVVETDSPVPRAVTDRIRALPPVYRVGSPSLEDL